MAIRFSLKSDRPVVFTVRLRIPSWVTDTPYICVNGEKVPFSEAQKGYMELTRSWNDDTIYATIDGIVKFERKGRDKKQASVYPVSE